VLREQVPIAYARQTRAALEAVEQVILYPFDRALVELAVQVTRKIAPYFELPTYHD
jgi:hypothetical protein